MADWIRCAAVAAVLVGVGGNVAHAQSFEPLPTAPPVETSETSEERPGPDYLRSFLWDATFLAGGTLWYWIDDRNIVDWDFDSWETRFSEVAYRFDNNEFPINYIGHPLSGAAFYGVPRANRLHWTEAFIFGLLTSFVWEFFLEFQERFSLNDFVVTPLGGLPIGEGFVQLARWLDNAAHPALAWSLGLPVALQEMLDGRSVGHESGAPPERPPWADVGADLSFGWAVPSGDGVGEDFDQTRLTMHAEFVNLEHYRTAGAGVEGFLDANVTRLRMDGLFSSNGAGFELDSDTMLAGVHAYAWQDAGDHIEGGSAIVGTSVSHFVRFENFDAWNDRLAFTGFPGLALQLEEAHGDVGIRLDGRLQPIFGGSSASSELPRWLARNPDAMPKSLLVRHAYWHGWGWHGWARARVRLSVLTLEAELRSVALDSQEGYDRNEELVTQDADGRAALLEWSLGARLRLSNVVVITRFTHQGRESSLDAEVTSRALDRFDVSIGFAAP
ncbi:MAG: DUF3943 domain-containing protein [Sandaracinaceae bacterium]